MFSMIIKMTTVTVLYVLLTTLIWRHTREKKLSLLSKIIIGVVYGLCAILSTHFGIDYSDMMLNVRDLGPLSAGLYFDPVSGIIAGLIGGIERYIAGTFWGVGSYTRIACSLSTCLAGFIAAGMHIYLFKRKKPSATYAFFMGAVMEVFHMYVVFITHRDDMKMAFYVVKTCSPPMIVFTGLGMVASSLSLKINAGEWKNPFRRLRDEEIPVSHRFQVWLFAVTFSILTLNLLFSLSIQTRTAEQNAGNTLAAVSGDIRRTHEKLQEIEDSVDVIGNEMPELSESLSYYHVGDSGTFDIINSDGLIVAGDHQGRLISSNDRKKMEENKADEVYRAKYFKRDSLCRFEKWNDELTLMTTLPMTEVYANRDAQTFESVFGAIILFAVIYVLISMLVQAIVVNNLDMINESLGRITDGNLNEVVDVRKSSEFASLSDDINQTVDVLKGYIEATEKRFEQELEFARTIQASALPTNFKFPRNDFEIYAMMDPAKEVGGDFYDFFFVDQNKLALVIADVSGKGIPAALFMMRAKTAIRGLSESGFTPSEILRRANGTLCDGNDAEMFVTVWLGIIDLITGKMLCANAGHEYPVLKRSQGDYEYIKDKHGLPLAAIEGKQYKEYELQMEPGDKLFVYTDGVPEAQDKKEQQYGTGRLLDVLNTLKDTSVTDTLPAIRKDIADYVGDADQFDDITMLGLTYFGQEDKNENTNSN